MSPAFDGGFLVLACLLVCALCLDLVNAPRVARDPDKHYAISASPSTILYLLCSTLRYTGSQSAMKTVCIIGAGPAGLAIAKSLLETGKFQVTVYEKNDRVGGIWSMDEDTEDGRLSPQAPVNLSRFTVSFSGLDWNSVDLTSKYGNSIDDSPPLFPKAWQVHKYLEAYREQFIPEGVIEFEKEAVAIERTSSADETDHSWTITTQNAKGQKASRQFDLLVIASGFYPAISSAAQAKSESLVPQLHSSEYRNLEHLNVNQGTQSKRNVVVIGNGISAGEAASTVSIHLSDAQWSSKNPMSNEFRDIKVIHVAPRPFYALPPFLESQQGSLAYVPIEMRIYNMSQRNQPLFGRIGLQTVEEINKRHEAMQSILSTDQTDIAPALYSAKDCGRNTSYTALTEGYVEFARSGRIDVVQGRVTSIDNKEGSKALEVIVESNGKETVIDNVAAIIHGTGWTASPVLDILPQDVKFLLQCDAENRQLPLLLQHWQTFNDAVPELAFIGWYPGPHWPHIEIQARATVKRWAEGWEISNTQGEEMEELCDLRQRIKERGNEVPQYWYVDYAGHMEECARHLSLARNDGAFGEFECCPSPARYLSRGESDNVAARTMSDMYRIYYDCTVRGKYAARAAFRALQGNWTFRRRTLQDGRLDDTEHPPSSMPESGCASFHPRYPSQDENADKQSFDSEYLYIETADCGSMTSQYIYRYSAARDELSVWSTNGKKNGYAADSMLYRLSFAATAESQAAGALVARSSTSQAKYTLPMKGVSLTEFRVEIPAGADGGSSVATDYRRPTKNAAL